MNIAINDVISLTYNRENQFLGQEVSRYRSVKNYTIQAVFHSGQFVDNGSILNFPLKGPATGYYNPDPLDTISINGYSLGEGRVTSLNIPQGDHIKRGIYNINFIVYEDGDLSNITSDANYDGLSTMGSAKLIDNISESFNFVASQNNTFVYDHTLNVTYIENASDAITLAKTLANQIFSATLPFPLITDPSISTTYNTAGKKYFTETYNLINKSCTFIKRFEILNNPETNYSHEYKNSITIDTDGIVSVTEGGSIKIKSTPFSTYISSASSAVIGGAYGRCDTLFSQAIGSLGMLGTYDSLNSIPIVNGKTINNLAGEIQYTVTFTNNAYIYQKSSIYGSHEFVVSLDMDANRVVNINENGNFTITKTKTDSYTTSQIIALGQALISDSSTRCSNFYNIIPSADRTTLKELGRSMDFNKNFKSLNYTISYTDDRSILISDPNFTKISYEVGADRPSHMYQEYKIPNITPFGSQNVYLYAGDQSNMGRFFTTVKAVAKRGSSENNINDTINNLITTTKFNSLVNQFAAAKRLTSFRYSQNGNSVPDNFVDSCNFSVDSDRNITLSLTDVFVGVVAGYSPRL
jgi:hypothetical protein